MSRRRPTLASYVRRRWRAIGAVVVLLLGSLLVLAVTDRGHDPLWVAQTDEVDHAAIAPDASAVYALTRTDGNITGLHAYRGEDGALLWQSELDATRALLAAGPHGVAVATDFPRAFLTFHGVDGTIRWQVPLEGNPVAIRIDGERIALALNAPSNPVLLFDGDLLIHVYHLPSPVRALDLQKGLIATGGLTGEVIVTGLDHEEVLNTTLEMSIRSLRLAHDGTGLVLGGTGLSPADPRGHVAFLDIGVEPVVRWEAETPVGVGLVDADAAGLFALAIEEAPPASTLHLYDGATGATRWARLIEGSVSRDDSGTLGGAAISPDGEVVAVATLRGSLRVFTAEEGDERWAFDGRGALVVSFAEDEPRRLLVAGRLLQNRPVDSLLLFSPISEPVGQRAGILAASLGASAAVALALVIGVGFWRARRPY